MNILHIPSSVISLFFEHLGVEDTLWNARRVCKAWNELAKKDSLLEQFAKRDLLLQIEKDKHKAKMQKISYFDYFVKRIGGKWNLRLTTKRTSFSRNASSPSAICGK